LIVQSVFYATCAFFNIIIIFFQVPLTMLVFNKRVDWEQANITNLSKDSA